MFSTTYAVALQADDRNGYVMGTLTRSHSQCCLSDSANRNLSPIACPGASITFSAQRPYGRPPCVPTGIARTRCRPRGDHVSRRSMKSMVVRTRSSSMPRMNTKQSLNRSSGLLSQLPLVFLRREAWRSAELRSAWSDRGPVSGIEVISWPGIGHCHRIRSWQEHVQDRARHDRRPETLCQEL
jgi:hypothetical protein